MFFEQFPKLNYDFPFEDIYGVEMLDVFRRVSFLFQPYAETNRPTFDYFIEFGDTPDIIAKKVYGSEDYWWLVCLFTNTINPFSEFPRTGFDRGIEDLYGSQLTVYLEKTGGTETQDFKEGDFLILASSEGVPFEDYVRSGEVRKLPKPELNNGEYSVYKITRWDQTLRKATVIPNNANAKSLLRGNQHVLTFDNQGSNQVIGKIKRVEQPEDQKLVGFQSKKTGFPISPLYNIKTTKVAGASANEGAVKRSNGDPIVNPINYTNTIINGFLGSDVGSTYDQDYAAVYYTPPSTNNPTTNDDVNDDVYIQTGFESPISRGKLRLLDPQFKSEAFKLFRDALNSDKYSIKEFSTRFQDVRDRRFAVPINPVDNRIVL